MLTMTMKQTFRGTTFFSDNYCEYNISYNVANVWLWMHCHNHGQRTSSFLLTCVGSEFPLNLIKNWIKIILTLKALVIIKRIITSRGAISIWKFS